MNAHAGAMVNAQLADALDGLTEAREEAALVADARSGSLDAFSRIVAGHQGGVYNYLCRRVHNRDDAEDLAQETFVRAWMSFDRYDARWRLSTWLYAIATRLAIDHSRKQRSRPALPLTDADRDCKADPAQPIHEREARSNLWRTAERVLSEEERAALWLKYAEELSSQDIARALGRSAIGVRVLLFRARRTLASALGEFAVRPEHRARGVTP